MKWETIVTNFHDWVKLNTVSRLSVENWLMGKILLFFRNVHYIERDGTENYYTTDNTPPEIEKKVRLLSYFRKYMKEHLMKAGGSIQIQESDQLSRIPYLHQWHRSKNTVIMQLTNGTLQVNLHSVLFVRRSHKRS